MRTQNHRIENVVHFAADLVLREEESNHDGEANAKVRNLDVAYQDEVYTAYNQLEVVYRVFGSVYLYIDRDEMEIWGEFKTNHGAPADDIGTIKREDVTDPQNVIELGTDKIY